MWQVSVLTSVYICGLPEPGTSHQPGYEIQYASLCASAGSTRAATREEKAFLVTNGVYTRLDVRHPAVLLTVKAACSLLQDLGAPAPTLAAVQGLQGAGPMTAVEISSLPPPRALQSAQEDNDTEMEIDGDVTMLDQPGENAQAPPAVQHSGQAAQTRQHKAAAAMEASPSLEAPETPVGPQPGRAALGAKRSSSDAFGVCAERLPGSKSLKAGASGAETAPGADVPRANVPRASVPRQAHTIAQIAQVAQPQTPPQAPESAEAALEIEDEHGDSPSLTFMDRLPELQAMSLFVLGLSKADGTLTVA